MAGKFVKRNIVLTGYVGRRELSALLDDSAEKIAMSPGAMLAFDSVGERYHTFDDLYPVEDFRIDLASFTGDLECLFADLDRVAEEVAGFPRSYTANIYWFIVLLGNVLYLKHIARVLKSSSERQTLLVDECLRPGGFDIDPADIRLDVESLSMQRYYSGLQNKVDILAELLGPHSVQVEMSSPVQKRLCSALYSASTLRNRSRYLSTRVCREKACARLRAKTHRLKGRDDLKGSIFVIQDKYEVRWLKEYLGGYRYVYPTEAGFESAAVQLEDTGVSAEVNKRLNPFLDRYFGGFTQPLSRLFRAYQQNVVTGLKSYRRRFEELVRRERPLALFYSIGAHNVCEEQFSHVANRLGVPVFYFQHGGASAYTYDPYQKYFEENGNVSKIRIFRSRVEKDEAAGSSQDSATGSITLHRLFGHPSRKSRKVLYLSSAFSSHAYKDLMLSVGDRERYRINRDIIFSASAKGLGLDVKLTTVDERVNYFYFRNLIRTLNAGGVRVLHHIPAESIIKNYGLVVLDYMTSALTSVVLMLDIPVVCYLPDTTSIKPGFLETLKQRVYLVNDAVSLGETMELFSRAELPSKWMPELVDDYAFDMERGDPGPWMASFIRSIIEPPQGVEVSANGRA